MRLFATLFFCLITSLAIAQDKVFISSLTNGTPPTLNANVCTRQVANLPFTCPSSGIDTLALLTPGGVTSIQPHGANQAHIYWTEQRGNKAGAKRVTFDLLTRAFLEGSVRTFPSNLASIRNFDGNHVAGIGQRQAGNRVHRFNFSPAGDLLQAPYSRFFSPAHPQVFIFRMINHRMRSSQAFGLIHAAAVGPESLISISHLHLILLASSSAQATKFSLRMFPAQYKELLVTILYLTQR